MEKLFIPILLGTAREGRASETVAKFVFEQLQIRDDVQTEFVDVRDHLRSVTLPPWGEGGADQKSIPWKEIAARADAFVFVLPEYNHGYPGEFKLLIDSLYGEYEKKPVAICGVSSGIFGGARLIDNIKPVLVELKMIPIRSALYFGKAKEMFNEDGTVKDEEHKKRAQDMFDDLVWHAQALRTGRENK